MSKNKSLLVDPQGKPVTAAHMDVKCPQCRAEIEKRIKSCGFGQPSTLCGICGYDFQTPWQEGAA